ncbi:hypothetical protein COCCADRAFT_31198 [Bipolaris zeicola 26-R-13]|uniref:Transmembrane protein n=1 Tax=Cochliobolus carbonum (strain 26-R-13) TaxID=930089 RepID=W6XPV5_COCC2|nr:uncharacterized protein COCCADRAFT_31198 [Bipolaris zeicola 26-R-13]EUC27285.1 hypothetical protein COCCADRAFT_31198 [Bipolaris zeicola 26-R-13]
MSRNQSIWCPSGGEWYGCSTGTFFAGCCAVNPCSVTCPQQHLYPVHFDAAIFGTFPDLSCGSSANFYTCSGEKTFFGCCKSNPCASDDCPHGGLAPAFMQRPEQIELFGDPAINNIGVAPITTSSVALAREPATTSIPVYDGFGSGPSTRIISPSVSITAMVSLCVFIAIWLGWRKLSSRDGHIYASVEPTQLSMDAIDPVQPDTSVSSINTSVAPEKDDLQRLSSASLLALLTSSLAVLAMCSFLLFLWFGDSRNKTWSHIMVQGWATRCVAVTALVLRTSVDIQATVACAILASLLLESKSGIHVFHTARISAMRTDSTSPWAFIRCVLEEFWRSTTQSRHNYHVYAMAICLLITTTVVQFSSTLLLSDLKQGPLIGAVTPAEVLPCLSYPVGGIERIARDSAWTTNPPNYATFGEYHELPEEPTDGVVDTGMLLRAFLPYAATELRQALATYTGNALTIDARVTCQAPLITEFDGQGLNGQVKGVVSPSKNATGLQSIQPTPFDCTVAGQDETTICQLGLSDNVFMGSFKSQFENSKAFGTAFLVIHGSRSNGEEEMWRTFSFPKTNKTVEPFISLTLCFAPWDAAILNVEIHSKVNRTEPMLRYWKGFKPSEVLAHLIPATKNPRRQIMELEKPHSFLGDLPPPYRRPVVQSDMGGSSAAVKGTNVPLPGNWSVFLTGRPVVTHLRNFESLPTQIISADPALAAIFTGAIEAGFSVEWALSSLITVLSMTNYYSQQAAFDRVDTVDVSFFENVLYPRSHVGLTIIMWTLFTHFALLALLVVLFITKTKLTIVGNVWFAFAQVAESQGVKDYIARASLTEDSTMLNEVHNSEKTNVRARLTRRGNDAEIVVE